MKPEIIDTAEKMKDTEGCKWICSKQWPTTLFFPNDSNFDLKLQPKNPRIAPPTLATSILERKVEGKGTKADELLILHRARFLKMLLTRNYHDHEERRFHNN